MTYRGRAGAAPHAACVHFHPLLISAIRHAPLGDQYKPESTPSRDSRSAHIQSLQLCVRLRDPYSAVVCHYTGPILVTRTLPTEGGKDERHAGALLSSTLRLRCLLRLDMWSNVLQRDCPGVWRVCLEVRAFRCSARAHQQFWNIFLALHSSVRSNNYYICGRNPPCGCGTNEHHGPRSSDKRRFSPPLLGFS